ncbi:hypothetical protein BGX38DRAFT_1140444 [Terfezia claveryi]|nr:hypothetical protein BGX38DRAFT_1140444 [Terfezia claveryi]
MERGLEHRGGGEEGRTGEGAWVWQVRVMKNWTDFLHDDHFFFVGTDGSVRRVVPGVDAGDCHSEKWEAAFAMIAAEVGTTERVVLNNLKQTLQWGAVDIGCLVISEADTTGVEIIPLGRFYGDSQEASASQKGKFAIVSARFEPIMFTEGADGDVDMSDREDNSQSDDDAEHELDDNDLTDIEEGLRGVNARKDKSPKLIIPITKDFIAGGVQVGDAIWAVHHLYEDLKEEKADGFLHLNASENRKVMKALRTLANAAATAWNMGAFEKDEGDEELRQFPVDDRSTFLRKLDDMDTKITEIHVKAGLAPKKQKTRTERELKERRKREEETLAKKRARTNSPSVPTGEFAKRKQGAIRWLEKELRRCYGGRDIRVVNITQERDGKRKTELALPEGLTRKQAREELPSVAKRIFADIKGVFWDTPVWKLVIHGVPFEGRETQAALREKLEAENGPMRISRRDIQRMINKGLKQKTTPIILEYEDREAAIKAAKQGVVVDGLSKTAEQYHPLPSQRQGNNRGSPTGLKGGVACGKAGGRAYFSCGGRVIDSLSVKAKEALNVRRSGEGSWKNVPMEETEGPNGLKFFFCTEKPRDASGWDGRGWWQESGLAALWIEKEELASGAWSFPEELKGKNWVAASNTEWVLVREWWAEIVAKVMSAAYEGRRKVIVAGDLNAKDDPWLGCAAGTLTCDEMRWPYHGEIISGICEAAGWKPAVDNNDPFTRRGKGVRQSALDVVWSSGVLAPSEKIWGSSDHAYLNVSLHPSNRGREELPEPTVKRRVRVTRVNRKRVIAEIAGASNQPNEGWWNYLSKMAQDYLSASGSRDWARIDVVGETTIFKKGLT